MVAARRGGIEDMPVAAISLFRFTVAFTIGLRPIDVDLFWVSGANGCLFEQFGNDDVGNSDEHCCT